MDLVKSLTTVSTIIGIDRIQLTQQHWDDLDNSGAISAIVDLIETIKDYDIKSMSELAGLVNKGRLLEKLFVEDIHLSKLLCSSLD